MLKISRVGDEACRLAEAIGKTLSDENASCAKASYAVALVLLATLRSSPADDRPEILDRTIDLLQRMIVEMESVLRELEEVERPC